MDYNNQGSHQSRNWNILNWNIRGLNSDDKCNAIKAKIEENACSVYCIQETKRDNFDHSFIKKLVPKRFNKFEYSPSEGALGGILMGWNSSIFTRVTTSLQSRLDPALSTMVKFGSSLQYMDHAKAKPEMIL